MKLLNWVYMRKRYLVRDFALSGEGYRRISSSEKQTGTRTTWRRPCDLIDSSVAASRESQAGVAASVFLIADSPSNEFWSRSLVSTATLPMSCFSAVNSVCRWARPTPPPSQENYVTSLHYSFTCRRKIYILG